MISAEFQLPDKFIAAYQPILLGWAADGIDGFARRPSLTIELRDRMAAQAMEAGLAPPRVTIIAEPWKHPVSGDLRIIVRPASELDAEIIALHAQMLPNLRVVPMVDPRRMIRGLSARFARMPNAFIEAYDWEIRKWTRNFKQVGRSCPIMLRRPFGAPVVLDDNGQESMLLVQLWAEKAEVVDDMLDVTIVPETERDEKLIRQHAELITRYGQPVARKMAN